MGPKEHDRARARPANGSYPETEGEMQTAKEEEQSSTTPSRATRHVERQPRSTGTAAHEELCVGIGPEPHLLNERHLIRLFRIRHGQSTERGDLRSAKGRCGGQTDVQSTESRQLCGKCCLDPHAGWAPEHASSNGYTYSTHTHSWRQHNRSLRDTAGSQ